MFTNKKFGLSDSLIEATKKVMENKTTDIQELTGKGKLPAIKAYHDSKTHDMFNRSDKVDAVDPRNRNKSGSRRTVTLKGQELWDRGMAHMRTARRAQDLMYKNKNKLQSEIADPAGSPAGGRITNAMDSRGKKSKVNTKADSVEVNPSLKEMTMKERTAFHMAAASAKRLGKSHFMFSGKKFPVKMTGDVAKQMTSEETVTEERWVDLKTKKFVQAPTREKAAELLNTLPLYIRKAPMQAEAKMSDAEVTRAHKIGKHFKKKGIGDEPYALATWLTQKKPGVAKKTEKTIKKED